LEITGVCTTAVRDGHVFLALPIMRCMGTGSRGRQATTPAAVTHMMMRKYNREPVHVCDNGIGILLFFENFFLPPPP
jgi:hypothetical protein